MAQVKFRAVIMDYAGDGERSFMFEAGTDFFDLPADEIVEGLVRRLSESDGLAAPMRYELNVVKRYPEKQLVCAIGAFLLKGDSRSPFIAMIGPA